jgi:hypothetical protein
MKKIVLTDEQAKILSDAKEPVEVRDAAGTIFVRVDPSDAIVLAQHRNREKNKDKQPTISGEQLRAHLDLLQQEWDRTGGFDKATLHSLLSRIRAEEGA